MVSIELRGEGESVKTVDALLDSGFTGAVSLPSVVVDDLGLEWSGEQSVTLGDGSDVSVDIYEGMVGFAGKWYRCAILATGDVPTVGMHLLRGARISFQAEPGGDISLERLDA